jgi:hypothetical protein
MSNAGRNCGHLPTLAIDAGCVWSTSSDCPAIVNHTQLSQWQFTLYDPCPVTYFAEPCPVTYFAESVIADGSCKLRLNITVLLLPVAGLGAPTEVLMPNSSMTPTQVLMKKVAYYHGVNTPAHAFFGLHDLHPTDHTVAAQQCAVAVEGLRWPLIVKHHSGYSSIGMGRDCKVENVEELLPQVR